ncbi:hypothetical protein D3C71_1376610 [compost metagenome]
MVAAVRPTEYFSAVVAGEQHDRVVGDTQSVELLQQFTNNPVQFSHRIGKEAKAGAVLPSSG